MSHNFNAGDRIRLVNPRLDQSHMLGWEGIVLIGGDGETARVRLINPLNPERFHEESYYDSRLQLIEAKSGTVLDVIHKLEKRQKFYKTYKAQLPTWYAAYGD